MPFLYYSLFAAAIVAADQFTKYLTVANISLYEDVPFLPGLLQLTYVRNTGAAFSSFEGQQWLFALIFAVFTGMIVYEYYKKSMGFTKFERWCIAAIYGGCDRDHVYGVPCVQCGRLLHYLRLFPASWSSGTLQ